MSTTRANVFQNVDIGKQSDATTAAATLTRLSKLGLAIEPKINFKRLSRMGIRFDVGSIAGKKWSGITGGGQPAYDEMNWVRDWLIDAVTPVTPGGGTNARERTHTVSEDVDDDPPYFTVRQGDRLTRAHQAVGAFLAGMGFSWDTDNVDMTVEGFAGKMTDGVQLSTNEVQSITVDAAGGTFTITYSGQTTTAIAYNAAASAVQSALEALSNIGVGDVSVTGGPGSAGGATPYFIEFRKTLGQTNVAAVTTGVGSLTGGAATAAVATVTPGVAPTGTEGVPIRAEHISVYLDTVSGSLGSTKLDNLYSGSYELRSVYGPEFVVDRAQAGGMKGRVPLKIEGTLRLRVQANAQGMGIYAVADGENDTYFVRVQAQGDLIETGQNYLDQTDLAVQVSNITPFSDEQGVYAIEYEFAIVYDPTWGKAVESLNRSAVATVS
jgi:hypothetical protein